MRILHYIPTYAPAWKWGGPVRSVSDLCEGLAARGHEVTVFTTDAGLEPGVVPSDGQPTERNGVCVRYFRQVAGRGILSPQLERAVAEAAGDFDLMHLTAIWQRTGPAAARAARRAGRPLVISPRGALGPYSWQRGRWKKLAYYWLRERATLRTAAGFHYTSPMEADECRPYRFGRPSCIVPNSIDLHAWRRDAIAGAQWRARLGVGADELLCLYAGRFHHKKGLDLLPAIFVALPDVRWRLVLVGEDDDGSGRELLGELARRGWGQRVNQQPLLPPAELQGLYAAADAFVFPSRHENFGNVAVEAAACGCRVLASDQTGVAAELAALGVADRLPRDASAWAAALRAQVGAGPLPGSRVARVREAFSRDRVAAEMENFYGEVLAPNPVAGRRGD